MFALANNIIGWRIASSIVAVVLFVGSFVWAGVHIVRNMKKYRLAKESELIARMERDSAIFEEGRALQEKIARMPAAPPPPEREGMTDQ